jgi:hypothetical protein
MITTILLWGALAGLVHFALMGLLYGNPAVDLEYTRAIADNPAMRRWPSKARYLATQFLGTQLEVYLVTAAFVWLRPSVTASGFAGALLLGGVLAAVRVYPRFWNMWIQTTYPKRLLGVELVNGTIGTLAIALFLQATTQA